VSAANNLEEALRRIEEHRQKLLPPKPPLSFRIGRAIGYWLRFSTKVAVAVLIARWLWQ